MPMRFPRLKITSAHVLALIALFASLGGTVYAAAKIDGKTIKQRSIPGNRLKPNAVTGAQVDEGSLATVPNATRAATAASATEATKAAEAGKAAEAARADRATEAVRAQTAAVAGMATEAKTAESALTATDAERLGGFEASAFQERCTFGGVQAVVTLKGVPGADPLALRNTTCAGPPLLVERIADGDFRITAPTVPSGALVTTATRFTMGSIGLDTGTPSQLDLRVKVFDTNTGVRVPDLQFTAVVF